MIDIYNVEVHFYSLYNASVKHSLSVYKRNKHDLCVNTKLGQKKIK